MHKLNGMGIRFSIDDFGTGYSSLSYLHRMPLCEIKIDKAFINELPHDSASESIVRAIIALGSSMQMTVLAEGIETAEQQAQLVSLGCQHMQGYLFARPVPLESLEARLNVGTATGQ
jgi:EAL domain-containing protein (putative c-di-GMP-specific phosphodiesterase class I)